VKVEGKISFFPQKFENPPFGLIQENFVHVKFHQNDPSDFWNFLKKWNFLLTLTPCIFETKLFWIYKVSFQINVKDHSLNLLEYLRITLYMHVYNTYYIYLDSKKTTSQRKKKNKIKCTVFSSSTNSLQWIK